jgi:transcriptional regulator with XRE-family HTH domain
VYYQARYLKRFYYAVGYVVKIDSPNYMPDSVKSIFAERMRARRLALDMSQVQLGKLTGIAQNQISRFELGQSDPTASTLMVLASTLHVSIDWLLGREDYPPDLPHQYGELNELEQQALRAFRSKSPERQPAVIEIIRLA